MHRHNLRIFIFLPLILFCCAEGQLVTQHVNSESNDGLSANYPSANPSGMSKMKRIFLNFINNIPSYFLN